MDTVRGLIVWLGAAVVASFGCTTILHFAMGGDTSEAGFRAILGLGLVTLIFTIAGSAALTLAFAAVGQRGLSLGMRYVVLIGLGAAAGGAVMLPFRTSDTVVAGVVYGVATASVWVGLHRAIYGNR
jgi:hypothetical protein